MVLLHKNNPQKGKDQTPTRFRRAFNIMSIESNTMNEFIEILLHTWREKGKFGLTFPFIVGALRLKGLFNGSASEACNLVLNQFQGADASYRLAYCDKADDFILAPVNNQPDGCNRIRCNGNPTSLWVQHDFIAGKSVESIDLFQALWERYGSDIEAERYSCTKGEYHPFNQQDLTLIDEAFNKLI